MNRLNVTVVILHVVGEDHQLSHIDKVLELWILEAFIDAVAFRQNAFAVIRFFDFNENQWQAVDQQTYIRSKFFIAVLVSQFRDDMKAIVAEVLKVDQLNTGAINKFVVKSFSEIIIV